VGSSVGDRAAWLPAAPVVDGGAGCGEADTRSLVVPVQRDYVGQGKAAGAHGASQQEEQRLLQGQVGTQNGLGQPCGGGLAHVNGPNAISNSPAVEDTQADTAEDNYFYDTSPMIC